MSEPVKKCPTCGETGVTGSVCPACGFALDRQTFQSPGNPIETAVPRGSLWLIFFAFFLGTPVLAILAGNQGIIPIFMMGTLASGFLLSKLFAKDSAMFVTLGIVFSVGVFAIYLGIAFVGCLVMMKGASF